MTGYSYLRPYNFETFEVGQAVEVLDVVKYNDTNNTAGFAARQPAKEATITVENTSIRWRIDGGEPDATTGHLTEAGASLTLANGTSIANFKAYAPASTAVLQVTYYNG
jgi:hypothetical protein